MAITITYPAIDCNDDVLRWAPPLICHVEGTVNYDPDNYTFEGVKVLSIKHTLSDGTPASGDPYSNADAEFDAVTSSQDSVDIPSTNINNGQWYIDTQVPANIDNDPAGSTQNHICAVALLTYIPAGDDPMPKSQKIAHHNWLAVGKDACPVKAAQKTAAMKAGQAVHTKCCLASPSVLPALDVTDGWIRYSFFSRSGGPVPMPPSNGFVLGAPGCRCDEPLKAREIAVAAGTVDWRPRRDRLLVVTRPYGIFDTFEFDGSTRRRMQFDGLTKFSLVVHQLRFGPEDPIRVPVDSDCRTRPLRIRLSSQKDIYVQVNNVIDDRTKSDGVLEFFVKVLT